LAIERAQLCPELELDPRRKIFFFPDSLREEDLGGS
jgi:hypothetical protein